jgi:dGTPase
VRLAPPLIAFSPVIREEQHELKVFLRKHLYQHYRVARMSNKAKRIVRDLFQAFMADSRLLPPEFQSRAEADLPRAIADYVAGMTDRYAIREHRRLFAVEES